MFYGRFSELNDLIEFSNRKTAGLIMLKGRRRIGKSRLVQQLGKEKLFKHYFEIQGMAPRLDINKTKKVFMKMQLDNFAE